MTITDTALNLLSRGIAAIPVKTDKLPLIKWGKYQDELPTETDLRSWFANAPAIAIVGGRVECLDFDEKYSNGIFYRFKARAEEIGLGGLIGELLRQRTPSGGYHLVWQCEGPSIGDRKLAKKLPREVDGRIIHEYTIETRGKGGYFLIHPSPGYVLEAGDFNAIPWITEQDREALLELAETFSEIEEEKEEPAQESDGISPADDYNAKADVPALLRRHGWTSASKSEKYWTRPGKTKGVSATWNVVPGRFYVFSTNAGLRTHHGFKPAWLYAELECGGDFSAAVSELRRQGFGGFSIKPRKRSMAEFLDALEAGEPSYVEASEAEEPSYVEGVDPAGSAPTTETEEDRIRRLLKARRFDPEKEPPPMRIVYSINKIVVSTPGNITAVIAPAKVGKSALMSAFTAAAMSPDPSEVDLLGVEGYNEKGFGFLFIDTEQAPDDFWHGVNRAKRRARLDAMPAWLDAYTVADLPAPVARKAIAIKMADMAFEFGGIHVVVIDGVADLVLDVNDAKECNELVAELHSLSIRYDCSVIVVLHLNPGSDKARGHLGSQIERKAESNLKIEKDDTVSVVWSAKQRRAPIEKAFGPRFTWSEEQKMHVSIAGDDTGLTLKQQRKVMDWVELGESVLKPGETMRWSQLIAALQEARSTPNKTPSEDTARRWINEMKKANVITVTFGEYALNPKLSDTGNPVS